MTSLATEHAFLKQGKTTSGRKFYPCRKGSGISCRNIAISLIDPQPGGFECYGLLAPTIQESP
jgi:hypothetical protein